MKKGILAVLAAVLGTLLVTQTPIGPLFVYGWLVPIIDPVIPKPAGVPPHAKAEYHWKGFGLTWNWDDPVTGGCARWMAAEGYSGPVRIVTVYEGDGGCNEGTRAISRMSFLDHNDYGSGGNDWPYGDCPFSLSEETISRYQRQVDQLLDLNSGELESAMLQEMRSELEMVDGANLKSQQYGCRVDTDPELSTSPDADGMEAM